MYLTMFSGGWLLAVSLLVNCASDFAVPNVVLVEPHRAGDDTAVFRRWCAARESWEARVTVGMELWWRAAATNVHAHDA